MGLISIKKMTLFDYVNYALLLIFSLLTLLPFVYVTSVSLTDPSVYKPLTFYVIPDKFSLASYRYILSSINFQHALYSTLYITIIGTILNLAFTFTMAYGLTKKELPHRKWIMAVVIFTLVFNAGILPHFLLIKSLGLLNSYWALIWSTMINSFSLIVIKSFLDSLPSELEDSAKIDGCSDLGVFFRIVLPLSMPAIAAFTLFFAVAHWNTYFNALIYLSDAKKWTLQLLVKTLIVDSNSNGIEGTRTNDTDFILPQETIRLAAVVVAMLPILIVYPFLQKYFAKGVLLGSVKG